MAKFYAAEIVLALEYMHAHNIVYRDLKPENLLLDAKGHMKIADFGFAKVVPEVTWTLCGTPEYLAPEIIQNRGHGKAVDWWSLGVLIYEMIAGYPPFYAETPVAIYEKIVAGVVEFPRDFDPIARDLICRLLVSDPTRRLGSSSETSYGVRNHPWFAGIDWLGLYNRTVPAPIVPLVMSPSDTRNFEEYPDESATGRPSTIPLTEDIQAIFRSF
jgi:serine/threonine protein kinase